MLSNNIFHFLLNVTMLNKFEFKNLLGIISDQLGNPTLLVSKLSDAFKNFNTNKQAISFKSF